MSKFAIRLRKLRHEQNKTISQVERETGISRSKLGEYELDKHQPSIFMAEILADYYHVSLDYLVGRTDKSCITVNQK